MNKVFFQSWLAAALIASVAGCATYRFPDGPPQTDTDTPAQGRLMGLALSGGGNRSAIYSGYVMELLASMTVTPPSSNGSCNSQDKGAPSVLDCVQYVSSVSGGSFANAYYAMLGHEKITSYSPYAQSIQENEEYREFFDGFHAAMRHNWEIPLFLGLRFSSFGPSNASRLAGEMDHVYLHERTLGEVQAQPNTPYLIFNATNYDDGRRFVMTTLPRTVFCVDVESLLKNIANPKTRDRSFESTQKYAPDVATCHRDVLTPDAFDDVQLADGQSASGNAKLLRVSDIVATSGAFPVFVGPLSYQVQTHQVYLQLIDGGVTDNSGVESLAELLLGKLIVSRTQHPQAVIIEIDASLPFDAVGARIAQESSPVATLIRDIARPSDIQELRAVTYRHDLWELARNALPPHSDNPVARLSILKLEHTEFLEQPRSGVQASPTNPDGPPQLVPLKSKLKLDQCKDKDHGDGWDATAAHAMVAGIPTRYALSDCDDAMLRLAACWSVYLHEDELVQTITQASNAPAGTRRQDVLHARIGKMCPELLASYPLY